MRPKLVQAVHEIAAANDDGGPWAADELEAAVRVWIEKVVESNQADMPQRILMPRSLTLAECARLIGAQDFVKLLTAKGKELGLLDEADLWDGDDLTIVYSLRGGDE